MHPCSIWFGFCFLFFKPGAKLNWWELVVTGVSAHFVAPQVVSRGKSWKGFIRFSVPELVTEWSCQGLGRIYKPFTLLRYSVVLILSPCSYRCLTSSLVFTWNAWTSMSCLKRVCVSIVFLACHGLGSFSVFWVLVKFCKLWSLLHLTDIPL